MPTLPTIADGRFLTPQGGDRINTTQVRPGDMGDGDTTITQRALSQAGVDFGRLAQQQRDRGRKLSLMRAKSALAAGLIAAEDKTREVPYRERLDAYKKNADKAYEEAHKLLQGDPEAAIEFEAYAVPNIANAGSRVSLGALKDERSFAVADYQEALQAATTELGQTAVGDTVANQDIIARMSERLETLVAMQALSPQDAQREGQALRETYAMVQYGKLSAKEQLEAVAKARDSKHKGWQTFLPARKLDALHDAAEAEMKVENTRANGQAAFDSVMSQYPGNPAAQLKAIRANKDLTAEERDDATARVDRQATRDRAAKTQREDYLSDKVRKHVAQGGTIDEIPAREWLALPLKEQEFLRTIERRRDADARAAVERQEEERAKADRSIHLSNYEKLQTQLAEGNFEAVAAYTMANIEASMPKDKWADAQADVIAARAALTKRDAESTKAVKAKQYSASVFTEATKKAYVDLGIEGSGKDDTTAQLDFNAAVRARLDQKRAELKGKDAVLTDTDVLNTVKEMTRLKALEVPGRWFGTNTVQVPAYQLDAVRSQFNEILKAKGKALREPSEGELSRLYQTMKENGDL